jgi:hypothetical protein
LSKMLKRKMWSMYNGSMPLQCRSKLDNWGGGGAHIHIFMFCIINFFWNWLFLWSVNTNIWVSPPIIELATALLWEQIMVLRFQVSRDHTPLLLTNLLSSCNSKQLWDFYMCTVVLHLKKRTNSFSTLTD